jgi:repressor LexA
MQDLGIADGDLVFIRRQNTARKGQVVAIMIDGETTLKTYSPRGKDLYLTPANKDMEPIYVSKKSEVQILGILDGVYHRFN